MVIMRSRFWLFVLVSAAALTVVLIAFGLLHHGSAIDNEIRIDLGCKAANPAIVERLALRYISGALARYPKVKVIGVRWSESPLFYLHLDDEYDRRGVIYNRDKHSLCFYNKGGEAGWDGVSPSMFAPSVNSASPFMAFKAYGCKSWP